MSTISRAEAVRVWEDAVGDSGQAPTDDELATFARAVLKGSRREVGSVAELDALPGRTIVLLSNGMPAMAVKRVDGANWWMRIGTDSVIDSEQLLASYGRPIEVLFEWSEG